MRKLIVAALVGLAVATPAIAQDAQPTLLTHRTPEAVAQDPANRLTLMLSNGGSVVVQLRPDAAPQHVYRIQLLASQGFYNGLTFHRVIPGFMAQTGDPTGTGQGGSSLPDLAPEFNRLPHVRGVLAMARAQDEASANSQFYLMFAPRMGLDFDYTVLGRVVEGMAVVDRIAPGEPPPEPTRIVRAFIGGPLPQPPAVAVETAPAETPTDADDTLPEAEAVTPE